jgi:hypothetical protein
MTHRTNPNFPDTPRPTDLDVQGVRLDLLATDPLGMAHAVDVAWTVDPVTRLIVDCHVLTHVHGTPHRTTGAGSPGPPGVG